MKSALVSCTGTGTSTMSREMPRHDRLPCFKWGRIRRSPRFANRVRATPIAGESLLVWERNKSCEETCRSLTSCSGSPSGSQPACTTCANSRLAQIPHMAFFNEYCFSDPSFAVSLPCTILSQPLACRDVRQLLQRFVLRQHYSLMWGILPPGMIRSERVWTLTEGSLHEAAFRDRVAEPRRASCWY